MNIRYLHNIKFSICFLLGALVWILSRFCCHAHAAFAYKKNNQHIYEKTTFHPFRLLIHINRALPFDILFIIDPKFGLLQSKPLDLFENQIWVLSFYTHILLGGLSLLVGWSQFSASFRKKRLNIHRILGKIYVLSVLLSGLASLYIAFYATGGWVTKLGFGTLGVLWLYTTMAAFFAIKKGNLIDHQKWMIVSFALTWAAVTLRLWLPLLSANLGFEKGYTILAWLCWVPNLLVGIWFTRRV